jgi:hypothetical protein
MPMRHAMLRRVLLAGCCALSLVSAATFAQPGGPMRGAATRSVSLYLGRERALAAAVDQRDRAAVEALIDDDFSARSPGSPDDLDREPWLRAMLGGHAGRTQVRDLSVREEGDVAVVSFLLDTGTGHAAKTQFVVDVWRSSAGKLLARYVAAGTGAPPPTGRPTGRE